MRIAPELAPVALGQAVSKPKMGPSRQITVTPAKGSERLESRLCAHWKSVIYRANRTGLLTFVPEAAARGSKVSQSL